MMTPDQLRERVETLRLPMPRPAFPPWNFFDFEGRELNVEPIRPELNFWGGAVAKNEGQSYLDRLKAMRLDFNRSELPPFAKRPRSHFATAFGEIKMLLDDLDHATASGFVDEVADIRRVIDRKLADLREAVLRAEEIWSSEGGRSERPLPPFSNHEREWRPLSAPSSLPR